MTESASSPPSPKGRERLDRILVDRGLAENPTRARALILAGRVRSGETVLDKAGNRFPLDVELQVEAGRRYVGRGAHKLAGALKTFAVDPRGQNVIDVGASTGGFTQVFLEAGAQQVVALDVGRGQLDWGLRQDSRVVVLEGVNARYLEGSALPFAPSIASIDVSFISLKKILPALIDCLATEAQLLALVKPQFEVGRGEVGKGGIVRDPRLHREVLERLSQFCLDQGWGVTGVCPSPIVGADGNREFFLHIVPGGTAAADLSARIDALFEEAGS